MKKLSVEYYVGLQDGISFAYNIGVEDADTAPAIEPHGPDYSKGFLAGFESVRTKIYNQGKELTQ